ncbi:hypothetical protein Tco_1580416 [Tanacetum coccineum]
MLILVKLAKSIFVDGSSYAFKMTPGCEKSSFKLPVFNRDKKDIPKGDPQGQTSSYVEVEALHSSSVKIDGHQNVYPESSNKNVESYENVIVSSTPSDKQVGTFEYEVGGVKYLMTPEEIAKQKGDEEIIKRKNQEEKASYAKIVNVLAKDERNLHIRRVLL